MLWLAWLAITSTGIKKGELFLADLNTQLKNKNVTTNLKVDTNSNASFLIFQLFTTISVDEPIPGLKTIFSFALPDQRSGKLELQYLHDYAGINTSIGLAGSPTINFSGVLGNNMASLGADVAFDSKSGKFTKFNAGFGFSHADLINRISLQLQKETGAYKH